MTFKKGTDNRNVRVYVRMTEDEKAAISDRAAEAGRTVSDYLRARGMGQRVHSIADQQTINELRRLGGLMKKVHTDSGGAYRVETAEALQSIVAAIKRIGG